MVNFHGFFERLFGTSVHSLHSTEKTGRASTLMHGFRALTNTGMDAAPTNIAALVRGKSAVAQGLGALPLNPWQEAVPPAPPVFQHTEAVHPL